MLEDEREARGRTQQGTAVPRTPVSQEHLHRGLQRLAALETESERLWTTEQVRESKRRTLNIGIARRTLLSTSPASNLDSVHRFKHVVISLV